MTGATSNRLRAVYIGLIIIFVAAILFYSAPAFDGRFTSVTTQYEDQIENIETPPAPEEAVERLGESDSAVSVESPSPTVSIVEDESMPEKQADEEPAVETPTAEPPSLETSSFEAPSLDTLVETPTAEIPTAQAPTIETPPVEIVAVKTPAVEAPKTDDTPAAKVSKMHYLIPASKANKRLCLNLASSAANRYPVPSILGYHGTGLFDAAITHLAKLRAIEVYLNNLEPEEDDDLVVIVDGYDIILQLPPQIMIERYFQVVNYADARIAQRFGISVQEARDRGLRNTVIWGPDKICWPIDWAEPRCWAVPSSNLPPDIFGPKSGNGDMIYNDPRWLNSGTVIGPIDDMRALITATMEEINASYTTEYEFSESDQYYISNIWGRQEYFRSVKALKGGEVGGGPGDRRLPTTRTDGQRTEYHIGIDYESAIFQTKAGYEPFFGYLQFNTSGLTANMDVDMFEEGVNFVPYEIEMPANVYTALVRLFDSIADSHPGTLASDWIRTIKLNVNYVTEHIFALWHCTGPKDPIVGEYPRLWFYPYARSLIKATVKAFQGGELITDHLVDGRKWAPKNRYPGKDAMSDELGGAWTDLNGGQFVEWHELCGEFADHLFGGEEPPRSRTTKATRGR